MRLQAQSLPTQLLHHCCLVVQVAAFQCLQPFLGTVLAVAVLGEEPSVWDLGAVAVIGGLILVSMADTKAAAIQLLTAKSSGIPGKGGPVLGQSMSLPKFRP